jgi:hypothetical protein
MLRDAQKCASVTEQAQRIGRSAAQAPHGLRRGMTSAGPCCSHDVRQRGYARVLAWHPPKREGSLLDLAQERSVPCESEALGCEKSDTPEVNLNILLVPTVTRSLCLEGLGSQRIVSHDTWRAPLGLSAVPIKEISEITDGSPELTAQ